MSRSLSYELRYGKGQSWGTIAALAISAYSAKKASDNKRKEISAQKEIERKRINKEAKALAEDRITQSRVAQSSQAAAIAPTTSNDNTKTFLIIGAIGLVISIAALGR